MTSDPEYTLAELASLADVPPRTIRYYIAQGLLPSPAGAGPATRYPAAGLARLRLVKQLQRQHLPLAEIRRRLAGLTDDEAMALAATPEPGPPDSALDYVRSLLEPEPVPHPRYRVHQPSLLREAPVDHLDRRESIAPPAITSAPPTSMKGPSARQAAPPTPERSQWERISLEPDVELHVRRPLSRIANKRVDRLVAFARQLLEEETP